MKIIKFLIICILIFQFQSYCGIKQVPKYIGKGIWLTISNPYIQKYGSGILFIYAQGICDAKTDGWTFDNLFGDKITYGISDKNWHFYKNIGRITNTLAFGLKGIGVGQGNFTIKETIIRTVSEGLIAWAIWHKVYYKTRYNNYWDTDHAQRIIYYPNPLNKFKDAYIGLKGNQVYVFDILRMSLGIGGLIYCEVKY